jgi:RimJ/RimL family protein N-acetyltransferase
MESIAKIFNHPKVYEWVSDDTCAPPYVPDPNSVFLMNEAKTAAVRIDHLNGVTCMVHIGALPESWGRVSTFVKDGVKWVFEKTRYTKIISFAPVYNKAAIFLGKRCGFKIEGTVTKSFLKNWELHDQVILGLSKYDEEVLCQ